MVEANLWATVSLKLMGMCFDVQKISYRAKVLLVSMADNAWDDGTHVFPSRGLLAHKICLSLSGVDRGISELKDCKLIYPVGKKQKGVVEYNISLRYVKRFARRFGICEVCGSSENTTQDHWIPKSKGGKSDNWNTVRLCQRPRHCQP